MAFLYALYNQQSEVVVAALEKAVVAASKRLRQTSAAGLPVSGPGCDQGAGGGGRGGGLL